MSEVNILTVPEAADIGTVTPRFKRHASLDAIDYQLAQAKLRLKRLARLVEDLESLRDERAAQIETGEWPAVPAETPEANRD